MTAAGAGASFAAGAGSAGLASAGAAGGGGAGLGGRLIKSGSKASMSLSYSPLIAASAA